MAGWPTVNDLGDYLNTAIEPADPTAVLVLSLAKSAVQAELGHLVDKATSESLTVDGNGHSIILLPQLPVTAIASVTVDGTLLTADTDYRWTTTGLLYRLFGTWGTKPRSIVIVYTHGSDDVPELARLVTLQLASRLFTTTNAAGVDAETIGSYSVTYSSGETPAGLTDDEQRLLGSLSVQTGLA